MEVVVKKTRASGARQIVKSSPDTVSLSATDPAKRRLDAALARRNRPGSISDIVANSKFYYVNWYYPEGRKEWPQHNNLRHVQKMYPYAEGGPLLVDEPRLPYEFINCEMKAKVLKRLGYRYLVIRPKMTVEEAMMELET